MDADLIIVPEVEHDLAEAYAWYENRQPGLGEEFLTRVDAAIRTIRRNPEAHPTVHKSYRRALIRRFPYAVFYKDVTDTITIYCVFHTARDPKKWRKRLP